MEIIASGERSPAALQGRYNQARKKAFREDIGKAKKLNAEFEIYQKGNSLACAHVINNFISFLSMSKNENERESKKNPKCTCKR